MTLRKKLCWCAMLLLQSVAADNSTVVSNESAAVENKSVFIESKIAVIESKTVTVENTPAAAKGVTADDRTPQAALNVRYPQVVDEHPREFDAYFLSLLTLALERSGQPFQLVPVVTPMQVEERSAYNLRHNIYDIHWLNSSREREDTLIPIRVPLFKGLAGWRLLLINKDAAGEFSKVATVQDLRRFKAGQGHDWPDNQVFLHNQLPLETSSDWEGLFKMLRRERIDYFPRSLFEIWREQALFPDMEFVIEDTLALHYPAAYYFFLGKHHPDLAATIEKGLLKAVDDGSFDALFTQRFGEVIQRSHLQTRTIIELAHPHPLVETKAELWFRPSPD